MTSIVGKPKRWEFELGSDRCSSPGPDVDDEFRSCCGKTGWLETKDVLNALSLKEILKWCRKTRD